MNLQSSYCKSCDKYKTCKTPCQPVLRYINSDYVPKREKTISELTTNDYGYHQFLDRATIPWGNGGAYCIDYEDYEWVEDSCGLTDKQLHIFFLAAVEGLTQSKIATMLNITRQAVSKSLRSSKYKILKELYLWNTED
jgi:predicted DNA binding protein